MRNITKPRAIVLMLFLSTLFLSGCTRNNSTNTDFTSSVADISPSQKPEPTKVLFGNEMQEYIEDNFKFSFSYPKSLTFEKQSPYPGGTIKSLGFRVDGLTESQLLSRDLSSSLKSNDLYCNLDGSFGEAVCTNKNVESYTNTNGTIGFKVNREKTFYDEDSGEPTVFQDLVYAFPIKEKNQAVSSYKALVFSIKYPSSENLEILKKIADTVKTF